MKDVLVTCPPMLGQIDLFMKPAAEKSLRLHPAKVTQVMTEAELMDLLPGYDGWIIGDDPATRQVFSAGRAGRLRAAVKWGIGVDNVDFDACKDLGIPIINTPQMFGAEVADVATGLVIGLARQLFLIDRGVRAGGWPKPAGISLAGRTVGVIGLGDIGRNTVTRLQALGLKAIAYDPGVTGDAGIDGLARAAWPERVEECDFLVFTCALNKHNFHMLNADVLARCMPGVRIVNVARGPLIDEAALIAALQAGRIGGAGLDVYEFEPAVPDALKALENAVLLPHLGTAALEVREAMGMMAVENLTAHFAGRPLVNPV
jgi:D-3-phosphoglycerate dehydrogenase